MFKEIDVLVLDGNQRSALAVVRSLGKSGLKVAVGELNKKSLSSYSRYCAYSFQYPSPADDLKSFIQVLQKVGQGLKNILLLPMSDFTMDVVLKKREDLIDYYYIPFSEYESYRQLSNKYNLFSTAERLGIAIPKTEYVPSNSNCRLHLDEVINFAFPVVLKPESSIIHTEYGQKKVQVEYAINYKQLIQKTASDLFNSNSFLIQEKIDGPGVGIFLLISEGKVLAKFAHQRIREKPPSGGVSVVCKSIEPPEDALSAAVKLLGHFNWSGVAMVEFKRDQRDGLCKLMEVNARFWGSLQLAISSGVDFPYLLYQVSLGKNIVQQSKYRVGMLSRWELGDLDHLLIRLKDRAGESKLPQDLPSIRKAIFHFLTDFFQPKVRHEILRVGDPKPFIYELKQYIGAILKNNMIIP